MKYRKHFLFLTIFLSIIILDQLTKFFIKSFFIVGSSKVIIKNIFSLTYTTNTGISFGLFKGFNEIFIIISVIVLIFFGYIYYKNKRYPIQIAFICAGIVGNLIDRIILGHVIDFLDFWIWPVFNLADSSISIGIVWLIIMLLKNKEDLF